MARQDRPGGARRDRNPSRRDQPGGGDLLYGRQAIAEALQGRRRHRRLLVNAEASTGHRVRDLMETATGLGVPVVEVERAVLDRLAPSANHQGVALETSGYPYVPFDDIVRASGLVLILDHLQDPQNVATLLRTAEGLGVAGALMPKDRAAAITPAVVNASAGAVEHLAITRVPNLAQAVDRLKRGGHWIIGLHQSERSRSLDEARGLMPAAVIVGAEGEGISRTLLERCDLTVAIPLVGRVGSLNAAVAGSIALHALLSERGSADASR